MAKVAVIYKSRYGSTEKYARWIAEETGADLYKCSEISPGRMEDYDVIVYGGALYAVNILGISLIKNNYQKIKNKKLIIFSVGASPETQKALASVKDKNFTREMQAAIHFFHLRGALQYDKMSPKHRFMMYMLKKMIEKKNPEERDEDSIGILESYGKNVDFTDRETIKPIVRCING
jgi:flavodoxin